LPPEPDLIANSVSAGQLIAAGLVTVQSKVAEKLLQKPLAKPLAERIIKRYHSPDKLLMAKRAKAYSWFWNWFLNFTQVL